MLDGYFDAFVDGIAASRDLPEATVRELVRSRPLSADEALAAGLVDEIAYPDEFEERIAELAETTRGVSAARLRPARRAATRRSGERVAVVFAQGTIVRGASGVDPWSGEVYLGSDDLERDSSRTSPRTTTSRPSSCASTAPAARRSPPT